MSLNLLMPVLFSQYTDIKKDSTKRKIIGIIYENKYKTQTKY